MTTTLPACVRVCGRWRLRGWCDEGAGWWEVSDIGSCRGPRGDCMVSAAEEPDPLCRERLALCRAVIQALDAVEAGGTDE